MKCPYCGEGLKVTLNVKLEKIPPPDFASWLTGGEQTEKKKKPKSARRVAKHRKKVRLLRGGLGIDCKGDKVNHPL